MTGSISEIAASKAQQCNDINDCPFGLWINALYDWCHNSSHSVENSLQDQEDLFFALLEILLRKGKVVLSLPEALREKLMHGSGYEGYDLHNLPDLPVKWKRIMFFDQSQESNQAKWKQMEASGSDKNLDFHFAAWTAPIEEKLAYMRRYWPEDITDSDDLALEDFFYGTHCPVIGWIEPQTKYIVTSI